MKEEKKKGKKREWEQGDENVIIRIQFLLQGHNSFIVLLKIIFVIDSL